ncbi:MAG: hypothetical protein U0V87_12635 [Acidobacteriota bacterium]
MIFYGLIESAALDGIDPKRYLRSVAENVLRDPNAMTLLNGLGEVADFGGTGWWRAEMPAREWIHSAPRRAR